MHKYIQKTVREEAKKSKISSEDDQSEEKILSEIRKSCETGQHISEQKFNEMLANKSVLEKQRIINELLMFGQIKIIHNLIKSKTLNKEEVIDSNKELKMLYETLLDESSRSKNVDKKKSDEESLEKSRIGESKQMSKKQFLLQFLKKFSNALKTMSPFHFGIVLGLILILLCVRKFKSRIIPLLKSLLNV